LTLSEAAAIEQDGYRVCQPARWPPPDVTAEASIITAGFPRHGRSSISWDELDLTVETVRAFVRSAGEDNSRHILIQSSTVRATVDVSAPREVLPSKASAVDQSSWFR